MKKFFSSFLIFLLIQTSSTMGIKTESIAAGSAITTHDPPKTSVGEVSPYDPENLLYYHTFRILSIQ